MNKEKQIRAAFTALTVLSVLGGCENCDVSASNKVDSSNKEGKILHNSVNLLSDKKNCGAPESVCPEGTDCLQGTCVPNLLNDIKNCGSIGAVCPMGTDCLQGTCVVSGQ